MLHSIWGLKPSSTHIVLSIGLDVEVLCVPSEWLGAWSGVEDAGGAVVVVVVVVVVEVVVEVDVVVVEVEVEVVGAAVETEVDQSGFLVVETGSPDSEGVLGGLAHSG